MFKKVIAAFLAAAAAVTALTVTAGAESILQTAENKKSGDEFTIYLNNGDFHDYKLTLKKKGDLKVNIEANVKETYVVLFDADREEIAPDAKKSKASTGSVSYTWVEGGDWKRVENCAWHSGEKKFAGYITYKNLDKGTYYLRIYNRYLPGSGDSTYINSGKTTVGFTFPDGSSSSSSSATIKTLQLVLTEGDVVSFTAILSGKGKATWSSSDSSIASVSNGTVKAKSTGTATITAKSGGTSASIRIKVI